MRRSTTDRLNPEGISLLRNAASKSAKVGSYVPDEVSFFRIWALSSQKAM
jgi:hypothetical protein